MTDKFMTEQNLYNTQRLYSSNNDLFDTSVAFPDLLIIRPGTLHITKEVKFFNSSDFEQHGLTIDELNRYRCYFLNCLGRFER